MLRPLAAVDDGPLGTDADGVATDISGGRRPHRAGAEEDYGGLERLDGCAGEAAGVTHGADAARCGRCTRVESIGLWGLFCGVVAGAGCSVDGRTMQKMSGVTAQDVLKADTLRST